MNNRTTITKLASRIAAINPPDHAGIALLGLMAGVLYSLELAMKLEYDDARKKRGIDDEKTEIRQTLEAIGHDRAPAEPWLAGFYLVSAIMRLDTFYERMIKYAGVKRKLAHEIHCVNNSIKHDIDAGIKAGWNIRFADVLRSTEDLCVLLEEVFA